MSFQSADRLAGFGAYFFAQLGKRIAALRAEGKDIIRIDIGAPDLPPPDFVVEALVASARRPDTHSYTTYGGTPVFKQAVADYYQRRFQVALDPATEVLGLIGSKEGLFHLAQALLNPGDVVLIPDPGYPTYRAGTVLAGAEPYFVPLLPENGFLPDLDAIPAGVLQRAKILWLNYPNNPTTAVASLEFFEQAVALPASTTSLWRMTRRMWTSPLTAMRPPASCKCPVQKRWPSSSTRFPRPSTWRAGVWA